MFFGVWSFYLQELEVFQILLCQVIFSWSYLLLQFCVGSEELYDETIGLAYGVPVLVLLLLIFLTDFYTFLNIDDYKQHSASHVEDNFLRNKCKVCNKHCHDQSTVKQKIDIPLKSTSISFILMALICMMFSPQHFVLPLYRIYCYLITVWFWTTVNIPMIVFLSRKNNFKNIASAR